MNFAVFASGNGTNLQAIIDACRKKKIKGALKMVFSDKPDAFALTRARKAEVPCIAWIEPKAYKTREAFDKAVVKLLKAEGIDFVVLAGFMRILSSGFVRAYKNRILNIHPALLPAFKGVHSIKEAFEYGVKVAGVTVHIVDEEMDHGPIVVQAAVEVKTTDSLASLEGKIHEVEHRLYPQAVDLFARGKIKVVGRTVRVG
ncbi:MAG: phosphoribosylglycinamide formyltransferase [Candidatus Omnitrophica bacterium]|nr:phosphoribosylglycinamide formyltransferase [Candidatus Omnitrophota bacterium]